MNTRSKSSSPATRRKLIDASVELFRMRGFNGTTVDDICKSAGVTKGDFFHYFESKDDLAEVALTTFREERAELFREAPFRQVTDPLERVFARLDFEKHLIESSGKIKGCLAGMLAQELAASRKEYRGACQEFFSGRADDIAADLAAAKAAYVPRASFDPRSVAMFYVAVTQGSNILSKASGDNGVRLENIEHLRTYLCALFGASTGSKRGVKAGSTAAR